jgi:hypothetical protein
MPRDPKDQRFPSPHQRYLDLLETVNKALSSQGGGPRPDQVETRERAAELARTGDYPAANELLSDLWDSIDHAALHRP